MILFATSSVIHLKNNGTPVTWKHNASQKETDIGLIGCAMHEAVSVGPFGQPSSVNGTLLTSTHESLQG
jgi:hypothetical protein